MRDKLLLAGMLAFLSLFVVTMLGESLDSSKPPPSHATYYNLLTCGYALVLLVAGWILYLYRIAPGILVDWGSLVTAVVCMLLFVPGLHRFCAWLYRHQQARRRKMLGPDQSTDEVSRDEISPWRFEWSLSIAGLIVLLAVAGISLVGLTHQIVWLTFSSQPALEMRYELPWNDSLGNLRNTGAATQRYSLLGGSGAYPPGVTRDEAGGELHSWQTLILGQMNYFLPIDRAKPWNDPHHSHIFKLPVPEFLNPAVAYQGQIDGYAPSHMAANQHVMGPHAALREKDISDGLSQTILAGQVAQNFHAWGKPGNWRDPGLGINAAPNGFGAPGKGALMILADGSVRFFANDTDPAVLQAMATPAGGEKIPDQPVRPAAGGNPAGLSPSAGATPSRPAR